MENNKKIVTKNKSVNNNLNETKKATSNDSSLVKKNYDTKDPNKKTFRRRTFKKQQSQYEQKVISISRITKVTKGGRQFRFAAIVIIGDKKSKVGLGKGKAKEVPIAIKKAINDAEKNLQAITIVNSTIPHEVRGTWCGSKVLIKPAKKGKGLIAGGSVRIILELAGIKNIYSKIFGSHTKINVIRATFDALSKLKTYQDYQLLRFFDQIKKIESEKELDSKNKKTTSN